jgi:hypothetical protein
MDVICFWGLAARHCGADRPIGVGLSLTRFLCVSIGVSGAEIEQGGVMVATGLGETVAEIVGHSGRENGASVFGRKDDLNEERFDAAFAVCVEAVMDGRHERGTTLRGNRDPQAWP